MAYTTIDDPTAYFQTKIYSGTGSDLSLTFDGNSNMQPDWVWLKRRSGSGNHFVWDSTRGVNASLVPNDTDAEDTSGESINYFDSFDSNGFTVGGGGYTNTNASGSTYVGWSWKANGGTTSSNSNGSITSTVQANTTAGFSIVSYTGTGSNATVGHGLSSAPACYVVKSRDTAYDWRMYHQGMGETKYLNSNQDIAAVTASNAWNDTAPTSSVFSLGSGSTVNKSGDDFIAYCFAEIKGYSKFGSYEGNGNNDGTFVYTGFKPAWVVTKSIDTTSHFNCKDNKRSTFNPADDYHKLNEPTTEDTGVSNHAMDFLSNGFKHRGSNDEVNGSETYIYMAFAESPFVSSGGIPTTAR